MIPDMDDNFAKARAENIKAGAEAERLRLDPAFQRAMTEARKDTLEQLASVDATDTDTIRRLQAEVTAIDLLATNLGRTIFFGQQAQKEEARLAKR